MKPTIINISKFAEKNLKKVPDYISRAFRLWVKKVELIGLREVRKNAGYHDEPLNFERKGQRSIRLNKEWRAFYILTDNGEVEIIEIIEVNKHRYKRGNS